MLQVGMLLQAGISPDAAVDNGCNALMCAVTHGQAAVLKLLLARGADPTRTDAQGRGALHAAALTSYASAANMMKDLVEAGASCDQADAAGCTALMLALEANNKHNAEALISCMPGGCC